MKSRKQPWGRDQGYGGSQQLPFPNDLSRLGPHAPCDLRPSVCPGSIPRPHPPTSVQSGGEAASGNWRQGQFPSSTLWAHQAWDDKSYVIADLAPRQQPKLRTWIAEKPILRSSSFHFRTTHQDSSGQSQGPEGPATDGSLRPSGTAQAGGRPFCSGLTALAPGGRAWLV